MIQIISDNQSNWAQWMAEVMARLEDDLDADDNVSRMLVIAEIEGGRHAQIIEFMNCDTVDVYNLGGLIQKEAIKHEIVEGLELDDNWDEFD